MTNQNPKYKKILIWLLAAIIIPLLLLATARLLLKTDWLRGKVVAYAVESVKDLTGAELRVVGHRGDLIRGVVLEGVSVVNVDTLIRVDRITVDYALWPLLRRNILIDRLRVEGLFLDLKQDTSGTLNVATLMPEADTSQIASEPWNIVLSDIQLNRGSIAYSREDGVSADLIDITNIVAAGSFRSFGSDWAGSLRSLEFKADNESLIETLGVSMSADTDGENIQLSHLLLSYGESIAKVAGGYKLASDSLDFQLQLDPVAARDINRHIDQVLAQNVQVVVSATGTTQRVKLGASVLDGNRTIVNLDATFDERESVYGLTYASAESNGFNTGEYISSTTLPRTSFADLKATFAGWYPIDGHTAQGDVIVSARQIAHGSYSLGTFETSFSTDDRSGSQSYGIDGLSGRFDGNATRIMIDGQKVERVRVRGRLQEQLHFDAIAVQLGNGRINASGVTSLDVELPVYEFDVVATGVDLSVINGFEELRTDLNANMTVSGIGVSESNREISVNLSADSSWVNQTQIDQVDATMTLVRDRLIVENAILSSAIADGQFEGEIVIDDMFRPSNNMAFNLHVKNLQPLAGFAGVETLQATGEIRGRVDEGVLAPELVAIVALDNIAVDSIMVDRMVGQYVMAVQTNPTYQAELDLLSPNINGSPIDDVRFVSRGQIVGSDLSGQFGLDLKVHESTGVRVQGDFISQGDTLSLRTTDFDIRGPVRTYRQASEFWLNYTDGIVTTDTLHLTAEPDARLMLHVQHASADSVQFWLDMQQVSLEALQAGLMSEPVIMGTMTGRVDAFYATDRLSMDSDIMLESLVWEDFQLDKAQINAHLENEFLTGSFSADHQGVQLLTAEVELPFKLGDPSEFEDSFYEQRVYARASADSLDTAIFSSLLRKFDLPELTGTVSASTELGGTAGEPVLMGGFRFASGSIGGIPVDRLELDWGYDQASRQLECSAELTATGQQVFTSTFDLPFDLDLRSFQKILPESAAPISGNVSAAGFDLALVSQFLPPDYIDQLVGMIDGDIVVSGTIGDPAFDGNLSLRNSGVRVVPANVVFRNMAGAVAFNRDRIVLESFSVRSGSGELNGNGYIQMDGFNPQDVSIDLRARQFLISDTRDMRAVASMDGKIGGTVSRPDLTGSMIVNSASIYLDNFGEKTVEEVQLEGDEPLQAPSIYDSLSVRMRVQVDPNVWVRNRTSPEMALELQGDMDLLKDRGSDLMAFGSLGTRQGYAMQYGKRFQLERGQLTFSGDPFNPRLDVVSLYELRVPEDIEIRYLITGTVNDPEFNFSSSPEMELENIISYTLFGKPFGALFSWQQTFSGGGGGGALARDAAIGVLVDRVESLATESLGIDVLQIDSNRQGETVTTSVKAGKYITDKLFVAVLNELGGSDAVTRVVLEYYIRRNLLLMLTQGNDRRSGVDLLWKYEY